MAPSQKNKGFKTSKTIVNRLWKKLSTSKGTVKQDTENDLVCDSVPDDDYKYKSAENLGQQYEQMKNMCNDDSTSKNEQSSDESEEEIIKDKDFSEKRGEEKRRFKSTNNNKSTDSPKQITNNVNVVNGSVHIGNETTQIYNIQQNYNAGGPKKGKKEKKHIPLTQEIKAILGSPNKVGNDHIEYLSKHFGKSSRDIGLVLELSSGQIDEIEKECGKNTKEMSFEILSSWMRNNGDQATLGKLCVELWNSKITRAREAVKLLSENINDFD